MIDPRSPDYTNTPADARRAQPSFVPADPNIGPAVSIVTPFYRPGAAAFCETVRSVMRQSLQQWEWILINDASPDAEARVALDELAASDPRIRGCAYFCA